MSKMALTTGSIPRVFSPDALVKLQVYTWPGNVRELRNVVERILIMAPGGRSEPILADMIPSELSDVKEKLEIGFDSAEFIGLQLREAREIFEKRYLEAQVSRFGGNISKTAIFIGMERSALHRKLKSLGVQSDERTYAIDK
jgi:two-component system nitrogen regulation response regulator NtrX